MGKKFKSEIFKKRLGPLLQIPASENNQH